MLPKTEIPRGVPWNSAVFRRLLYFETIPHSVVQGLIPHEFPGALRGIIGKYINHGICYAV